MNAPARMAAPAAFDASLTGFSNLLAASGVLTAANQPLIRTGRLALRRPVASDAPAISAALQNGKVARMLARVPQPYYLEDAEDWLASMAEPDARGWHFAITLGGVRSILTAPSLSANGNVPDRMIGVVSIEWKDTGADRGWHLGYWLDEAHWSEGIMTEAANAAIARFFSANMGAVLHAGALADNPASLRVQEKLGFDVTGVGEAWCQPRAEMVKIIETELTFGSYMPM
jgi:RimJ/RimL family protein N-acetyltransferase